MLLFGSIMHIITHNIIKMSNHFLAEIPALTSVLSQARHHRSDQQVLSSQWGHHHHGHMSLILSLQSITEQNNYYHQADHHYFCNSIMFIILHGHLNLFVALIIVSLSFPCFEILQEYPLLIDILCRRLCSVSILGSLSPMTKRDWETIPPLSEKWQRDPMEGLPAEEFSWVIYRLKQY